MKANTRSTPGRRAKRLAIAAAGALASAALIGTAFFRVQWAGGHLSATPRFSLDLWISELGSNLGWVALFAALTAVALPLRAIQWRYALGARPVAFGHRYHALAIGAFVHNALPGKLGEVGRALVLSRRQSIPFFESFGSVLVSKLLEFAALVAVVALALVTPWGGDAMKHLGGALPVAGVVLVVLSVLGFLLARYARRSDAAVAERGKLSRALAQVGLGFQAIGSPARVAVALFASFGPILAAVLAYGFALHGLGVEGGLLSGAVVLGAIALGQMAPGLPVGVGMYYLTSSWAARALGAGPAEAASFAFLTHIATSGTQLLVGFASVVIYRIRPRELLRRLPPDALAAAAGR